MGKQEYFWILVAAVALYIAYRHGLNVGRMGGGTVPSGLPAPTTGPTFGLGPSPYAGEYST